MSRTRTVIRSLSVCALAALAGLSAPATAQTSTSWTYQGVLELGGGPANGAYDLVFLVYAGQQGGSALATANLNAVPVTGGRLTTPVDFGSASSAVFGGGARWLEIRIRPVGNGVFTTLPRQPLNASPRALALEGLFRDSTGRFGINTASPAARLDIQAGGDASGSNEGRPQAWQWWNGGFRHWLTTRHDTANGNGNAMIFWINSSPAADGSSAPGTGNVPGLSVSAADGGRIGIGTVSPQASVHGRGATPAWRLERSDQLGYWYEGRVDTDNLMRFRVGGAPISTTVFMTVERDGRIGIGANPDNNATLNVAGNLQTQVLTIVGGADIAEPFNVHADAGVAVRPGMVVAIDAERTGELRVADRPYDRAVAGIISGANGVNPGLTLTQAGSIADGKHPVAMTGRVWVLADASSGPIRPGDLLTSSSTPGHAMAASDPARAGGASLGKAMSSLESGTGYVLVLVNLH